MITKEIIRIASDTRNIGLTNKFHFRSSLKNSICGDKIKLELIVKHLKINSMKYEIESCVYCEASASLLAKKVKNLDLNSAIKDMTNQILSSVCLKKQFKQITNLNDECIDRACNKYVRRCSRMQMNELERNSIENLKRSGDSLEQLRQVKGDINSNKKIKLM